MSDAKAAPSERLRTSYLEMLRVHVDEGGQLSHRNGIDLLAEVERLNKQIEAIKVYILPPDTPFPTPADTRFVIYDLLVEIIFPPHQKAAS